METCCAARLRTAVLFNAGPGQNARCMSAKESSAERCAAVEASWPKTLPEMEGKKTESLTPKLTGARVAVARRRRVSASLLNAKLGWWQMLGG